MLPIQLPLDKHDLHKKEQFNDLTAALMLASRKLSKRDRKAEKRKHLQWDSNKKDEENHGDVATTDAGNEPKDGKKKKGKKRKAATEGHTEASAKTDKSEKAVSVKKKGKGKTKRPANAEPAAPAASAAPAAAPKKKKRRREATA